MAESELTRDCPLIRPTRLLILAIFAIAACSSHFAGAAAPSTKAKRRPNFVFFLADDMGWRDAGCYGSTFYETPNIDRLAKEGMRFTNAYAACPVCSPTRASIMTGKYPARLGTTDYFGAPQPDTVQRHWTRNKPLLPARYWTTCRWRKRPSPRRSARGGYATLLRRQMAFGRRRGIGRRTTASTSTSAAARRVRRRATSRPTGIPNCRTAPRASTWTTAWRRSRSSSWNTSATSRSFSTMRSTRSTFRSRPSKT